MALNIPTFDVLKTAVKLTKIPHPNHGFPVNYWVEIPQVENQDLIFPIGEREMLEEVQDEFLSIPDSKIVTTPSEYFGPWLPIFRISSRGYDHRGSSQLIPALNPQFTAEKIGDPKNPLSTTEVEKFLANQYRIFMASVKNSEWKLVGPKGHWSTKPPTATDSHVVLISEIRNGTIEVYDPNSIDPTPWHISHPLFQTAFNGYGTLITKVIH